MYVRQGEIYKDQIASGKVQHSTAQECVCLQEEEEEEEEE